MSMAADLEFPAAAAITEQNVRHATYVADLASFAVMGFLTTVLC